MTRNLKTRHPIIRAYLGNEVVVDSFAGGGGASTGIELALGRSPDIAINHDPEAIAMHAINHPTTQHYIEDIWAVDPEKACAGKSVGLAWFSPTCTHFSKAKGTALGPEAVKIRGQAWIVVEWAKKVAPRIILLENVEEFQTWGPLHETHTRGCKRLGHTKKGCKRLRGECTKEGCKFGQCSMPESKRKSHRKVARCVFNTPIKERAGEIYREWRGELESLGYVIDTRVMRACDFGAPTTRRRFFLQARRDGEAHSWPEPTHGPGRAQPFRTAAEIIDWSVPCPSIFERDRPLADKTLARIARGIQRFVLDAAKPFVIPVNHGGYANDGTTPRADHRVHDLGEPLPTVTGACRGSHAVVTPIMAKAKTYGGGGNDAKSSNEPLSTVTASKRGEHFVAVPYLVHRSNGERPEVVDPDGTVHAAQAPRVYDIEEPLGTIVAGGLKHAACVALLIKNNGGNNDAAGSSGQDLRRPLDTIACRDQKSAVIAHVMKYQGTSTGSALDEPLPTITAGSRNEDRGFGGKLAQVASFFVRYNGESEAQPVEQPLGTIDTTDRYGLITVTIDGEEYVLVDIGMRMLTPRELYRAQGFADTYEIEPEYEGKPLTKTAQIRMAGNSVCPPIAAAIVRAALGIGDVADHPKQQHVRRSRRVSPPRPLKIVANVPAKPADRPVVRAVSVTEADAEAEVLALLEQGDEQRAIEAMVKKLGVSRAEAQAMAGAA